MKIKGSVSGINDAFFLRKLRDLRNRLIRIRYHRAEEWNYEISDNQEKIWFRGTDLKLIFNPELFVLSSRFSVYWILASNFSVLSSDIVYLVLNMVQVPPGPVPYSSLNFWSSINREKLTKEVLLLIHNSFFFKLNFILKPSGLVLAI